MSVASIFIFRAGKFSASRGLQETPEKTIDKEMISGVS